MTIAVDKYSYDVAKKDDNEYVYLFDDEPIDTLIETNLHCINYKYCDFVDINTTKYKVPCTKQTSITVKDWNKLVINNYKIGIIIPNYNYAEWVPKCLNSIAQQNYKNYEVIFIDDMSVDNSVNIARTFIDKLPNIQIVELQQKRYNGGARNEGYLYLSDDVDYVYYIDSDDWLQNNHALQDINTKLQSEPDVLFVGIMASRNGIERPSSIPKYKDKYEALKGWSGSCGKVIKKELAMRQECLYNEGTLKEDKNQHCRICIYMNSFDCLEKPIYVWNQDNRNSITTIREQIMWGTSTIRHYADTKQLYLSVKGQDPKIDKILEDRLRLTKQEMESGNDRQW